MNKTDTLADFMSLHESLNIPYTVCEILVAVVAVIGNALVILVFKKERRLRRRTNYYIISLAAADFLVGLLGIPFAILASVGLPSNLHACLFTVSLLVVLCTISIFCLVAVSIDRYWAILHPMGYSRNVRTKTALVIISVCWMAGTFVGFLPLLGWHSGGNETARCFFVGVMDYNYLVFLYFATIITPSLLLLAFYAHIYRVVLKQLRQIVTMNPRGGSNSSSNGHIHIGNNNNSGGGTMLRMLGAAQKREVKATQNLSIIVLFFIICWIPLYTINCIQAFCKDCKVNETWTNFFIILSHLNSAGNPLLYAYHLRDFRAALKSYILALFGYRETKTPLDRNCRTSLASTNYSNRLNYVRNLSSRNQSFVRNSVDNGRIVPICMPIVATTTTVAAASAGERTNRDMWMIAEVPSASVSEHNAERDCPVSSIRKEMASETSSSGRINSGYVEGPIDVDLEIGDDEVFYADASTLSESEFSGIINKQTIKHNIEIQKQATNNNNKKQTWCLSSSSPQLSRSLFLVEDNMKHLETERRSSGIDRKSVPHSKSGEFSPNRSLKLSPFRAVGEFLLQRTANKHAKSVNKIEDVSYKDLSLVPYDTNYIRNGGSLFYQQQMNRNS